MVPLRFIPVAAILLALLSCGGAKHTTKTPGNETVMEPVVVSSSDTTTEEEQEGFETTYEKSSAYHAAYNKVNDLLRTRLEVRPDWNKQYLYGKAWITFRPHFYPTDSLTLDAKAMEIAKVELVGGSTNTTLTYQYDTLQLHIKLNKTYTAKDSFIVYIEYTARPDSVKGVGSAAINDAKGLYFINADGKDPNKPKQLWSQGETESNSAWFPTIDKPNMKTTFEISITADTGMVTLSNGLMTNTKKNNDGTHTDTWKLDKPFAPYLAMMAIGKFSITKDKWKNIEVNYYTDPEYAKYAKDIFGNTPEMMDFYSKKFGFDYPWPKYSQVIVHDFVSGAMENVTATVHYDALNQTKREMIDEDHEDIICHELSHHWFGDLVTCESWSNLPLNESFATYNEFLWLTYKRGKDEGDYHAQADMEQYLGEAATKQVPLIRYHYADKEDMFDGHSYQKGGCVLRMLNNYVGDEAFTKALSLYLNTNKFRAVEIADLRKAFEEVTGQDLSWFFNDWFMRLGHPVINIRYIYSASSQAVTVIINQHSSDKTVADENFEPFTFPIAIDVYSNGSKTRHTVWMKDLSDSFTFPCASKPDLVNVDADKVLLCSKTDDKTEEQWIYQYQHAPLYLDRKEAIQYFTSNQFTPSIRNAFISSLDDKFWRLRKDAVEGLDFSSEFIVSLAKDKLVIMAKTDPSSNVRAAVLTKLMETGDTNYLSLYRNGLKDSSYAVIAASLEALSELSPGEAIKVAKTFENEKNETLSITVMGIYAQSGDSTVSGYLVKRLRNSYGTSKFSNVIIFGRYLTRLDINAAEKDLPVLYEIAEKETQWVVRFAAVNALESVKIAWKDKISEMPGNSKTESWKLKLAALQTKMNELKEKEQNDFLKSIYNRDEK